MNIIKTKLNSKGELIIDKVVSEKQFRILTLTQNPFLWTKEIQKNTDNFNEKFVKNFLKDNGLSFNKLSSVYDWVPYYYTAFLMELANSIKELGIVSFKDLLKDYQFPPLFNFKFEDKMLDLIPETIDKNTKVGVLSDIFNPFTNVDFMMFVFN